MNEIEISLPFSSTKYCLFLTTLPELIRSSIHSEITSEASSMTPEND